ncbi:TlpA family protein disulfide reductase [Streptomyces sp. NBC_01288]|jgi:thiol-disulfide isomerase/thioredoxin|uniref:TlpA family protein disulfide reductase n=1 Tax=unclassified Streptomyces TaxID=2593676 RepID=UPI00190C1257|nr:MULTISPECIES: TlpA disulfide reductase family protein [unclassified Streptomyces]MBK3578161.1 TlpA family protein disulfide reductase [Streptomyces sp. MBT65]WSL08139.1 TlpA family protein disulfide reductase [Streptomyces sp. NBC_01288]WSW92436.1 TlpA family protein disulfide reductase [Streptomyces sp. NBC_00989]
MSAASRARSRAVLSTAGVAVAALVLSACSSGGTSGGSGNTNFITGSDGIATVKKGDRQAAPDLSGKTIDGKTLNTADYKGKVLVVNVWGSWCSPCRAEADNLVQVAKATADKDVQFVGLNTRDTSTEPAVAFEKKYEVPYPSLYDPTGRLMLRFKKGTLNPQAIPSTIVIDRDGKIAARALQALSEDKLREMLDPVIAEK